MATRATLKSYFETGDVPTQSQFAAFIDSVHNIDDDGTALVTAPIVADISDLGSGWASELEGSFPDYLTGTPWTDTTGITGAETVDNIVRLTQVEYDNLGSYDAATLYVIEP